MNGARVAPVRVVPMTLDDIGRVMEIDTLSFPLPWSPTSYRYELTQNPNSHFVVAVSGGEAPARAPEPDGLVDRLRPSHWFRPAAPPPAPTQRNVVGYGGFWFIIDEAHISTIAVHPDWRGQGVGESLFVQMLEQALDLGARTATLEVRVTNDPAQRLYYKYEFEQTGRRKRYYRDNGEDALLLTAELHPGYREAMRQRYSETRKGEAS
ncbi:MAG: ribosomal protein S18-alanine N-acetyltransferase [Anaerolineales bacterium]